MRHGGRDPSQPAEGARSGRAVHEDGKMDLLARAAVKAGGTDAVQASLGLVALGSSNCRAAELLKPCHEVW